MPPIITIKLPKSERERLKRAALSYGFSPETLSRRIIADATREFLEMPEESWDEYENPAELRASFRKAVMEAQNLQSCFLEGNALRYCRGMDE